MFFSQYFRFPLSVPFHHCSTLIHPSTTHTVYWFSPSTSGFPYQYHSTIAPYSSIQLPPMLWNDLLSILQIPPVSIFPPTQYYVLLPVLQVSPVSIIPPLLHTHPPIYKPHCKKFFSQHFSIPLSVTFHYCSKLIHPSTTHTVKWFSPSSSVSPVSIIPPLLHTHPSIYQPICKMFSPKTSSFPCQYHSTISPHTSIHLPPILYYVFLPVLQFPLSVPFHHCSVHIQSSTTPSYDVFSQYLRFPLSVSFHHCSITIHPSTTHAV